MHRIALRCSNRAALQHCIAVQQSRCAAAFRRSPAIDCTASIAMHPVIAPHSARCAAVQQSDRAASDPPQHRTAPQHTFRLSERACAPGPSDPLTDLPVLETRRACLPQYEGRRLRWLHLLL
jgi:hypothetical protein